MKLTDLQEARADSHSPKMKQLLTAAKELGISTKLPKNNTPDDYDIDKLVSMKKAGVGKSTLGPSGVAIPLNTLVEALKKLPDTPLSDVASALRRLEGVGFEADEKLRKLQTATYEVIGMKSDLLAEAARLQAVMHIMGDLFMATKSTDDWRRSISTAVLKNVGYPLEN